MPRWPVVLEHTATRLRAASNAARTCGCLQGMDWLTRVPQMNEETTIGIEETDVQILETETAAESETIHPGTVATMIPEHPSHLAGMQMLLLTITMVVEPELRRLDVAHGHLHLLVDVHRDHHLEGLDGMTRPITALDRHAGAVRHPTEEIGAVRMMRRLEEDRRREVQRPLWTSLKTRRLRMRR